MSTNNSSEPTFDFGDMSLRDSNNLTLYHVEVQKATEGLDREKLEEYQGKMQEIIASAVTFIPQAWLVNSAPKNLDWSDPDSLGWVRGDRFKELMDLMVEAQTDRQKK